MELFIEQKKKYQYYLLLSCVYLFIFQNFLEQYFSIFKIWDETFAIISFALIFVQVYKYGNHFTISKYTIGIVIMLLIFTISGILGNYIYGYQTFKYVILDLFLNLKFFLSIATGYYLFRSPFSRTILRKISWHSRCICILLWLLYVLDCFTNNFSSSTRYGIHIAQLFYQHSTILASICAFQIILLVMYDAQKTKGYIIAYALLMALTLRSKAIASAILIIFFIWYIIHKGKKISFRGLIIISSIAIMVALPQINFYYVKLAGKSARSVLTETAAKIAKDYFPIGTGFGTYASYCSSINYSKVYYIYRLENHGELGINTRKFISDTFWPMIIGQNGLIGLAAYVVALYLLIHMFQLVYKYGPRTNYCCCMIGLFYMLISSAAESAFVNPISIPLAFCIGINLHLESNQTNGGERRE